MQNGLSNISIIKRVIRWVINSASGLLTCLRGCLWLSTFRSIFIEGHLIGRYVHFVSFGDIHTLFNHCQANRPDEGQNSCIFKIFNYIDDQWNFAPPSSFPEFDGRFLILGPGIRGLTGLSIHDKLITGEISWGHCGC